MREALLVIAEVRDSERLRQFLELGQDRTYSFLVNSLDRRFEFIDSW